ncbi:MAG: hypothetical protein SGBAC_011092, partial [Bacillariaceae sp.]
MGRSQVLYNRTKGRFRNKVRSNQSEQPQSQAHNDRHPRGYHHPISQEAEANKHESSYDNADSSHKKRSRNRSTIGQNTTINESEMLLLAASAAPQYYVEDDSSTIFGGGTTKDKATHGMAMSASSLDVSSLETTLLTCVSIADRLKLPSHVAQSLQMEGSTVITTTIPSRSGVSLECSPRMIERSGDGKGEEDSEDGIRNDRIRKHLLGDSPTKTAVPPTNVTSPQITEDESKEEDSFLASLSVDDDESAANVLRPSYSGIKERGASQLPAAPSMVYGTMTSLHEYKTNSKKKDSDDASYSIGPNKIKATEQGDIEVRIKKKDDASRQSREFDVDRYAIIDEDDEDSYLTSDHSDAKQRLPSRIVHVPVTSLPVNKTRNKVAAVSAGATRTSALASGKLDPPATSSDPPAGDIPLLRADPSDDSEMLENWLDDVVGGADGIDGVSSAAIHPMEATGRDAVAVRRGLPIGKNSGSPVSSIQGFGGRASNVSTMSMPKEVTIPQRPIAGVPYSTTMAVDLLPTSSQEDAEDTLESWLDDVI